MGTIGVGDDKWEVDFANGTIYYDGAAIVGLRRRTMALEWTRRLLMIFPNLSPQTLDHACRENAD